MVLSVTLPSLPLWAAAMAAALVGALVGSFLNVVVYRVPRRLSIIAPGSFCPSCRRPLAWWENVPVLGWLALRGRCRTCKAPIAPRYPLVEAGNAAIWAAVVVATGGRQATIPLCILSSTIVTIWLIELDGHRAPRSVGAAGTALAVVATVIARLVAGHGPLAGLMIGTAAGTAAYLLLVAVDRSASTWAAHGRTALVPAGPFLGTLPLAGALAGAGVIVVAASGGAVLGAVWARSAPLGPGTEEALPQAGPEGRNGPGAAGTTGCGGACATCGSAGACATSDPVRPIGRRLLDLGILAGAVVLGAFVAVAVAAAAPPASWP